MAGLGLALVAVGLTHPLWLTWVAQALIAPSGPPAPADAIMVLGGGGLGYREAAAMVLYDAGYAPALIASGGGLGLPGLRDLTFAELSALELETLGAPPGAIEQFDQTRSTCDEATAARNWADANDANRLLVVTDPFHTRRAGWIFARAFRNSGTDVVVLAAEPNWFEAEGWWLDTRAGPVVVLEYAKSLQFWLVGCGG